MLREHRRSEWNLFFRHKFPMTLSSFAYYCSYCGLLWSPFKDVASQRHGTQTELTLLLGS